MGSVGYSNGERKESLPIPNLVALVSFHSFQFCPFQLSNRTEDIVAGNV